MSKYTIGCSWTEYGFVEVEAETEAEAVNKAIDGPLPQQGEYIPGSFEVDPLSITKEDA